MHFNNFPELNNSEKNLKKFYIEINQKNYFTRKSNKK